MNFRSERNGRKIVALEVTPLVDIVFLLLIFFLLTATYVKNPSLDISLPKASMDQVTNHKKDITISVKNSGELRFENQQVSKEKLEGILLAEYAENEKAIVIIRADKEAMHGRVVEIMDMAKRVGFEKLAIAIQKGAAPAQ